MLGGFLSFWQDGFFRTGHRAVNVEATLGTFHAKKTIENNKTIFIKREVAHLCNAREP